MKSPASLEPQYGGWCVWAMSDSKGDEVAIDAKPFTVEDGQLYLFDDGLFGDTRKGWNKAGGAPKLSAKATQNWQRDLTPKN